MNLNFAISNIRGVPGFIKYLQFDLRIAQYWGNESFLCGLDGQLLFGQNLLSESVMLRIQNLNSQELIRLGEKTQFYGDIFVAINNECINFIEDKRNAADIQLNLKLVYRCQEILKEVEKSPGNDKGYIVGPTQWKETSAYVNIPRSQWVGILSQLKYSEIEIFEVNKSPLISDKNLEQALKYIKDAETALRDGNYDGVLADCRSAFESAAKYASEGQTKLGFQLMLEKSFEEKKVTPLDALIRNVSEFAQLGRHAEYPAVTIARDEAEFILISTINIFSLLSRRLAKIAEVKK